jgi:hypothetical protein
MFVHQITLISMSGRFMSIKYTEATKRISDERRRKFHCIIIIIIIVIVIIIIIIIIVIVIVIVVIIIIIIIIVVVVVVIIIIVIIGSTALSGPWSSEEVLPIRLCRGRLSFNS